MATPELAPAWQPSVQQRVYRALLGAMSEPGQVADLAATLGSTPSIAAILAAVVDHGVTVADPHQLLTQPERRLLGARDASPGDADFVVLDGARAWEQGWQPQRGTLTAPDESATLVLRVAAFSGPPLTLSGPGIETTRAFSIAGLHATWLAARAAWCGHPAANQREEQTGCGTFPLGVDCVFVADAQVAAWPRTTRVMLPGEGR